MELVIIGKDGRYYYKYDEQLFELNETSFEDLKSKVSTPLTIHFKNCHIIFIGDIISNLFEEVVELSVKKVSDDMDDYDAVLTINKEVKLK